MSEKKQKAPRVVHCEKNAREMDVYVGRKNPNIAAHIPGSNGEWGNPYEIGKDGDRNAVLSLHYEWTLYQCVHKPEFLQRLKSELRSKTLGCWCAPMSCHADLYLQLANESTACTARRLSLYRATMKPPPPPASSRIYEVQKEKTPYKTSHPHIKERKESQFSTSSSPSSEEWKCGNDPALIKSRLLGCSWNGMIAFCDGASHGNGGASGSGLILSVPTLFQPHTSERTELVADMRVDDPRTGLWLYRARPLEPGTNNVAELTALLMALEAASCRLDHLTLLKLTRSGIVFPSECLIFSDSTYAVQAVLRLTHNVENRELVDNVLRTYDLLRRRLRLSIYWVKGHASNQGNRIADDLASRAARGQEVDFVLGEEPPLLPSTLKKSSPSHVSVHFSETA